MGFCTSQKRNGQRQIKKCERIAHSTWLKIKCRRRLRTYISSEQAQIIKWAACGSEKRKGRNSSKTWWRSKGSLGQTKRVERESLKYEGKAGRDEKKNLRNWLISPSSIHTWINLPTLLLKLTLDNFRKSYQIV